MSSEVVANVKSRRTEIAYAKVASDLRRQILNGKLGPGRMIPSLRRISEQHSVAMGTAQQAVKELIAEGLLRTEDGRGTFVADVLASRNPIDNKVHNSRPSLRPVVIGIVTPLVCGDPADPANPYGAEAAVGSFARYTSAHNAMTRTFGINDGKGHIVGSVEATRLAIDAGCDLLLAVSHIGSGCQEISKLAKAADIPVVFAGSDSDFAVDPSTLLVTYDNVNAGAQAAEHLFSRGVKDLIFFSPMIVTWARLRLHGALGAALKESGAAVSAYLGDRNGETQESKTGNTSLTTDDLIAIAYDAARAVVAGGLKGRGVIAASDYFAFGFMKAAAESGFEAGRDYAILGFDDHPHAVRWNLTSMQPPWHTMGEEAARLAVESLSGELSTPPSISLCSHIIARCSSFIEKA